MKHPVTLSMGLSGVSLYSAVAFWGTNWAGQMVQVPIGWLVLGSLVLTFFPALALITAIQRRLGVTVEVDTTDE